MSDLAFAPPAVDHVDADATLTVREQQARILFALGVMHYRPGSDLFASERTASRLFDTVIHIARGRGFKGGRKLESAARYGKATPRAMEHMRAACSFHTESEINLLLAQTSNWVHFLNTGRPMPGWTFKMPADVPHGRGRSPNERA